MIKAATTTLTILLFCGAVFELRGQPVPGAQIAGEEAVRRQADIIQLRKTLDAAQTARTENRLVTAAQLYEEALELVQRIGPGIDEQRNETITGLTEVRMELAEQARRKGDLIEANKQIDRVLRIDPTNKRAQELNAAIDRALKAQEGRVPSAEIQQIVPEVQRERVGTSVLVQDARLLIEMGKLDEAEAKLRQAVQRDPEHQGAFYYLKFIQEAKFAQEARKREVFSKEQLLKVEQAWHKPISRDRLPAPNPYANTNLVKTSKGRERIYHKLDTIILNEVLYDEIPLSEVVNDLSEEARRRDPDRLGINIIINSQIDIPPAPVTFGAVDPVTGAPLPAPPPPEPVDLNNVLIRINPPLRNVRLAEVIDAVTKVANRPLKFSVEDYAVVFTQRTAETPQLFTRRFKVDPNTFLEGLESVTPQFLGVGGGGGGGGLGGGGGGGGLGGGGGGLGGGGGGGFAFPRVDFTGGAASLGGGGLGGGGGGFGGGGFGGGGGGLGGGGLGGAGGGGLGGIGGGLGVRGLTYLYQMQNVQDMARAFFAAAGIDFPTNQTFGGPGDGGALLGQVPGTRKALFYNDRAGIILARATLEELDLMEQAIQALNVTPPQVEIEARFTEISQNDSRALGFDWFLGNWLTKGGAIGTQAGTAPSFQGAPSAANPLGAFPGIPPGVDPVNPVGTVNPSSATDQNFTTGLRNVVGVDRQTIPALATVTGILTDPQFRVVIRALEQRSGVDVLSAPRVTTLSGRQAKIDVTELKTIVSNQGFQQQGSGGGFGAGGAVGVPGIGAGGGAVAAASQFETIPVPLGPSLDVIPYVSADGYSVQMTIMPTLVEFLGYDDPGPFLPQAQSAAGDTLGAPLTAQLPLPAFRVRQVVTQVNVWDGQTVVLGGLIAEDVTKIKDKVPIFGDIPLLGRFFRSESMATTKKNLVIFVTPTIIDPAGNRVHLEGSLPFDPSVAPAVPVEETAPALPPTQ